MSDEEFTGKKSTFVTPRASQGKIDIPRVEDPEPPAPVEPVEEEAVVEEDEQGVDLAEDDEGLGDDEGEEAGRRRRRR